MRARDFLSELQGGMWREIRAMVPKHWPDYVVKDWLYVRVQKPENLNREKDYINWILNKFPIKQWRLENLDLGYHSFNGHTQQVIISRANLSPDLISSVPRDKERHQAQAAIIKKTGQPNQEPIIVISRPDGYELIEGWHRTIENAKAFPNGWKSKAWVGYL